VHVNILELLVYKALRILIISAHKSDIFETILCTYNGRDVSLIALCILPVPTYKAIYPPTLECYKIVVLTTVLRYRMHALWWSWTNE